MERLKWYLKQLLPLNYETTYTEHYSDGTTERKHATWKMFMGRCYAINENVI